MMKRLQNILGRLFVNLKGPQGQACKHQSNNVPGPPPPPPPPSPLPPEPPFFPPVGPRFDPWPYAGSAYGSNAPFSHYNGYGHHLLGYGQKHKLGHWHVQGPFHHHGQGEH